MCTSGSEDRFCSCDTTAPEQNSAELAGSATLIIGLLQEIIDGHSDKAHADFNDCGDGKDCKWCEDAKKVIHQLK